MEKKTKLVYSTDGGIVPDSDVDDPVLGYAQFYKRKRVNINMSTTFCAKRGRKPGQKNMNGKPVSIYKREEDVEGLLSRVELELARLNSGITTNDLITF